MPTYVLVTFYMILAGTFTPLLRYVSGVFSPIVQNGVRFTVGGLLILSIAITHYRKNKESVMDFIPFVRQKYLLFLAIILLMATTMSFMSVGLKYTSSFTGTMFSTFGIPFTTIIAAIYFPDERKKASHFTFIIGMIICIIGSYIFISSNSSSQVYDPRGIVCLTISVIAQVILNNLIKYLTREHSVVYVSTINALGVGILLLTLAVITGQIKELFTVPPLQVVILMLAGLHGIFMGMVLGFTLLKKTGLSNFNVLLLITPIVVAIFAYIFFDERHITMNQIKGAIFILTGAAFCVFGQKIYNRIRSRL